MKRLKLGQVNYISVIKSAEMLSDSTYDIKITRSDNSSVIELDDTLLNYRGNAEFLTLSVDLTSLDSTEDNTTCTLEVYIGTRLVASYHSEMVSSLVRERLSTDSSSIYYSVTRLSQQTP
jgi:hypothetical protein